MCYKHKKKSLYLSLSWDFYAGFYFIFLSILKNVSQIALNKLIPACLLRYWIRFMLFLYDINFFF